MWMNLATKLKVILIFILSIFQDHHVKPEHDFWCNKTAMSGQNLFRPWNTFSPGRSKEKFIWVWQAQSRNSFSFHRFIEKSRSLFQRSHTGLLEINQKLFATFLHHKILVEQFLSQTERGICSYKLDGYMNITRPFACWNLLWWILLTHIWQTQLGLTANKTLK